MPPEQRAAMCAMRDGTPIVDVVDRRADVYSVGAIVYELLGGSLRAPIRRRRCRA
jgi:hypothetical protein